ncbi:MarR family transcriptional regulator [Nonomuraea fuscirosea]|uniref:MarR family winged helix-turn-helix transcriptional regulator n=1 Tax=Nonomuraea fuscirosea TaxID=1291556 RepID=UPI0034162FFE
MNQSVRALEYEAMLLWRHRDMRQHSARGDDRHLDRSAYVLLSRLELEGAMSIGQLSEAFKVASSTINRQSAAMLCAGLVERIPDPEGGIARKFRVTEEGRRRLNEERDRNVRGLERILAGWSEEDTAAFAAYLRRFNAGMASLAAQSAPGPLAGRLGADAEAEAEA